jgi:hypothetical protein
MPEASRCQHVKSNGIQCGSPALKDNHFCFYHQHCHPIAWNYKDGHYGDYSRSMLTLPAFEDAHSIQITLRHVVEFILQHRIDDKKAGLVLYALQMASSNLKRLESEAPNPDEIVTDPPLDPVREFQEEEERRRQANHAEFERMFPTDPKPAPKPDDRKPLPAQASDHNAHDHPSSQLKANKDIATEEKANNELPPGTIHACVDESRKAALLSVRPTSLSQSRIDKAPVSRPQLEPASGGALNSASRATFRLGTTCLGG